MSVKIVGVRCIRMSMGICRVNARIVEDLWRRRSLFSDGGGKNE